MVWNGLTDLYHPTQILADLLTVQEEFGRLDGLALAYVGDGRNNMANSLMVGCARVAGARWNIRVPQELATPAVPGAPMMMPRSVLPSCARHWKHRCVRSLRTLVWTAPSWRARSAKATT